MEKFMEEKKIEILKEIKSEADTRFEEVLGYLEEDSAELESILGKALTVQMEELRDHYYSLENSTPCHMVISYLRTALLDRHPLYSVAMYDEDFYFSRRECLVMWDIPEISEPLYKAVDELAVKFEKQSKVESYYLDEIVHTYGDGLHGWFMNHIPQIIRNHLMEYNWREFYSSNGMCIWAGEYRHQIKRIFKWGK
jgi:hypothetical protein